MAAWIKYQPVFFCRKKLMQRITKCHYKSWFKANNAGDTAFIVDVTQAGIFLIDGVEEERLPYLWCLLSKYSCFRSYAKQWMTWSLKEASRNCCLHQLTSMLNSKRICNVLKQPLLKVKLNRLSLPNIKKTAYAVFFIAIFLSFLEDCWGEAESSPPSNSSQGRGNWRSYSPSIIKSALIPTVLKPASDIHDFASNTIGPRWAQE